MSVTNILTALDDDLNTHLTDLPKDVFTDSYLDEAVDLLDNLGYVNFSKDDDQNLPTLTDIRKGITKFRAEYKRSVVFEAIPEAGNELSEYELDKLGEFSDLEGGFKLSNYPDQWQIDPVLLRIMVYRMSLLGLFVPTSDIDLQLLASALETLQKYLKLTDKENVLEVLDDFNELIKLAANREWQKGEGFHNMMILQYDGHRGFDRDEAMMKENMWTIPQRDRDFYSHDVLDKPWLTKKVRAHCDHIIANPFNTFMARLIQIKLWMDGFYHHEIDGDMRIRSIEAMVDLHELVLNSQPPEQEVMIRPTRFLYKLGKGYWLVNYKFFLLHGLIKIEDYADAHSSSTKAVSAQLEDLLDEAPDEAHKKALLESINEALNPKQKESKKSRRKKQKVRKSKGFMRMAIGFLKRIRDVVAGAFERIKEMVLLFFKKVKNAAGYVIREIREALAKVKIAFKFFFSKRVIQSEGITTDFDGDFDVVSVVSGNPTGDTVAAHQAKVHEIVQAMKSVFEVLPKVIGVIIKIAAGPVGWVQLGMRLVKILLKEQFDLRMGPVLRWV